MYKTERTVSVQRCFTAVYVCLSVYRTVRTVSVQRCFTVIYVCLSTELQAQLKVLHAVFFPGTYVCVCLSTGLQLKIEFKVILRRLKFCFQQVTPLL